MAHSGLTWVCSRCRRERVEGQPHVCKTAEERPPVLRCTCVSPQLILEGDATETCPDCRGVRHAGSGGEASPKATSAPAQLATGSDLRVLAHEQGLAPRPGETDAALRARMLRRMSAGVEQLGQEQRLVEASAALARPVAQAGDLVVSQMLAHDAQPFFDLQASPPAEPPGVVRLRADLGTVASAAARVLGLLGCPFPAVHRLTFDAREGWRAFLDAGDGKPWRLRADSHGDNAHAAVRTALEWVARWLARCSPFWSDRLPEEPLREALAGLIEAVSTGYARAGGSW